MQTATVDQIHVRYSGQSDNFSRQQFNLRPDFTDDELREALAKRYDCGVANLSDYVIVREPSAIIIRPFAIYG
jgi:hypothetical protein